MSATIEVEPETAEKLTALAQSKGVSVDALLHACIPGLTSNGTGHGEKSQAEKIEAFIIWAENHSRDIPPLSDEAASRRSFYKG